MHENNSNPLNIKICVPFVLFANPDKWTTLQIQITSLINHWRKCKLSIICSRYNIIALKTILLGSLHYDISITYAGDMIEWPELKWYCILHSRDNSYKFSIICSRCKIIALNALYLSSLHVHHDVSVIYADVMVETPESNYIVYCTTEIKKLQGLLSIWKIGCN